MSFGLMEGLLGFLYRQVGTRADPANGYGSVHGKLTDLRNTVLNIQTVKSVQRGITLGSANMPQSYVEAPLSINIATVNPAKCLVLLDIAGITGSTHDSNTYVYYGPYLESLTANVLTIVSARNGYIRSTDNWYYREATAWQLIEFY